MDIVLCDKEDDFEAFESYAMSNRVAEVRVNILHASEGTAGVHFSQGEIALQGQAPETDATYLWTGTMPSSLESSRAMPRLGVMSPVSQTNGSSGSNNVPAISLDRVSKMMSDRKDTQTRHCQSPPVLLNYSQLICWECFHF